MFFFYFSFINKNILTSKQQILLIFYFHYLLNNLNIFIPFMKHYCFFFQIYLLSNIKLTLSLITKSVFSHKIYSLPLNILFPTPTFLLKFIFMTLFLHSISILEEVNVTIKYILFVKVS